MSDRPYMRGDRVRIPEVRLLGVVEGVDETGAYIRTDIGTSVRLPFNAFELVSALEGPKRWTLAVLAYLREVTDCGPYPHDVDVAVAELEAWVRRP